MAGRLKTKHSTVNISTHAVIMCLHLMVYHFSLCFHVILV